MRHLFIILLLLTTAAALSACSAPPRGGADSIGIALDMLVEHDDSAALYRIAADGTIAFAGGYDARMRRFTWTGYLAIEEVDNLRAALHSPFWRDIRRDGGRPDPGERRTTVTIHQPVRNRIIIRGDQPEEVLALESLLKNAAARRLESELQALPRPGPMR